MIKLKGREKIILYFLCGLIGAFLFERIFFSTLRSKIKMFRRHIKLEEANFRTAVEISGKKDKIIADYAAYSKLLAFEQSEDRQVFAAFLKEIERIGQRVRISISSLNPQDEIEKTADAEVFLAELKAEASVRQIFNFLSEIQNSDMPIKLDKLTLTPKNERGEVIRIDTKISMMVSHPKKRN